MIFVAMFRRLLIPSDTDSYIKEGKPHLTPTFLGCTSKQKSQYSKKDSLLLKINGNRIEPAEIEAAVKQVLGVSWVAAKGFNEANQSYICASLYSLEKA